MRMWGIFAVFAAFGVILAASYVIFLGNGLSPALATMSPKPSKEIVFAAKGPRQFSARKTKDGLTVSGEIAADSDRDVLARFAAADKSKALTTAGDAGSLDWLGGQLLVLEALDQAITGDVDIIGSDIALSVYVDTDAEKAAVERLTRTVPPGFEISTAILVRRPTIDPFQIKLEKVVGGDLVLTGYSESEDDRFALMVEAAKVAGEAALSVDLKTGLGMPAQFVETARAAFPLIGRLQEGKLEVQGRDITLTGTLAPGATLKEIKEGLRPLPGNWKLLLED